MTLSICIPTYKREDMLRELLSMIPKTVHVFVSDNGGSLSSSFIDEHNGVFVKKTLPEVAMFSNWNIAAFMAQDEWFILPSDDDIYYPNSFEIIKNNIEIYGDNVDMLIFGHHTVDGEGEVLSSWNPKQELCVAPSGFERFKFGVDARMPSIVIRTSLFKKLGGFCEEFKLTASDSDFIQRASLVGNIQFIPEVVAGYRVWDGGATHNTIVSVAWMREIDLWCNRIQAFCDERGLVDIYSDALKDEIYIRNLTVGIRLLKPIAAYRYLKECRFSHNATLKSKLRLLYNLLK